MNIRIRCAAHNHEHVIFSSFAFDDELTIDVVPCPQCTAQHGLHQTACAECGQALYHKENCPAINHPLAIAAGKA